MQSRKIVLGVSGMGECGWGNGLGGIGVSVLGSGVCGLFCRYVVKGAVKSLAYRFDLYEALGRECDEKYSSNSSMAPRCTGRDIAVAKNRTVRNLDIVRQITHASTPSYCQSSA